MYKGKKIGIALEGGGAKGAYQLGVWKALIDLNIDFDGVVGTSIGAINAATMIMGKFDKAIDTWQNNEISSAFITNTVTKEEISKLKTVDMSYIKNDIDKFMIDFLENEGTNIAPVIEVLKKNIDEALIRNSKKDFGITTYDLTNRKPLELFKEDIPINKLADYIFASCYLPVFKAQKLDGRYFLDGGFFNPLPINMLINKGYENIIAIRLRPVKYDYSKFCNVNIIDIAPKEFLGNTLDMNLVKMKKNFKIGYKDTINTKLHEKLS